MLDRDLLGFLDSFHGKFDGHIGLTAVCDCAHGCFGQDLGQLSSKNAAVTVIDENFNFSRLGHW